MANAEPGGEAAYDAARLEQWMTGRARGAGMSRRGMLRTLGTPGLVPAARPAPDDDDQWDEYQGSDTDWLR